MYDILTILVLLEIRIFTQLDIIVLYLFSRGSYFKNNNQSYNKIEENII